MDPTTVVALVAGLAAFLKVLDMLDRMAHTFGMTKMLSAQLHHLATMPNNKLAPVEEAIAEAVDQNKDEAAIATAEKVASTVTGASSIGQVANAIVKEALPDVLKAAP